MFCNLYYAPPVAAPCARIDLKDAVITIKDGFAGTGLVNDAAIAGGDNNLDVDTLVVNGPLGTDRIPVGAKMTFATAEPTVVRTVTARTPADGSATTTNIVFTPVLNGAALPADNEQINFTAIELVVKIGEGNLTYTETTEYEYLKDRGKLDTVKLGDETPLEVSLEFSYESATTGTNESVSPVDAVKRAGSATEWTTSATDQCEPYAVDIEILHTPTCGTKQKETTTLPDFRKESLEFDFGAATIAVSGKCNKTTATVVRS